MSHPLILITGATGHLGFAILIKLLQHGYRARIAHRRPEHVGTIKQHTLIEPFLDAIEFVQVPDVTAAGAYESAIRGMAGVIHVASPIPNGIPDGVHDRQKLLYGVLNILEAASREQSVKRVVVKSSGVFLTVKERPVRAGPYDFQDLPGEETRKAYTDGGSAYMSAKLLAHLAGTQFMEENKPRSDLIRILPGYVQGANALYTSVEDMQNVGRMGSNEGVVGTALGWVTGKPRFTLQVLLDDVAKAHGLALEPEHGRNLENLLLVGTGGESIPWSEFVEVIKRLYPEEVRN